MFRIGSRDIGFPLLGSAVQFGILVLGGLLYAALVGGSADLLITAMFIDAAMVVGLQIYIGNTGVLSFGHIGFGAIAGYAFAVLAIAPRRKSTVIRNAPWNLDEVQLDPLLAGAIAVGITVVVAVVIGVGLARSGARSGAVSATVITLALLFVTHEVARNWTDLTGGDRAGLSFGPTEGLDSRIPILIVLAIAIVVARLFAQSRSGRLAIAAREDNLAARAMGVQPEVQQMIALVLSVAIVAAAATLRVYDIGNITPRFFFFDYTLLTLVMLIVGGRNSLSGALVGVVVITAGRELTRRLATDGYEVFGIGLDGVAVDWLFREGLSTIFLGLAMVGFMIFRPNGLLDDWEFDQWMWRRAAAWRAPEPDPLPEVEPVDAEFDADSIRVTFGGFTALEDAGLTASGGEIVGLIGPNGAGKTTMINVFTGLVEPTGGILRLDGRNVTDVPTHQLARSGLVRTFQNLRLFGSLTVRENVEVSTRVAEMHRPDKAILDVDAIVSEAGLWEHRDRRARELDYGNARRLELARAVAMAPSFLLLDEPTSGMSDAESQQMVEQVRHMAAMVGAGVIVIDHDLGFITGISDRIYALDQGRIIAEGTPAEVQANERVQAAYLGSTAPT